MQKTFIFDIKVKDQGHIEVMNVCNTLLYGIIAMCLIWFVYIKEQRSYGADKNPCGKNCKFDLQIKGRHHLEVMNVGDTLSHGNVAHIISQ